MVPSWMLSAALVSATHHLTHAFLSCIRSLFYQGERRSVDTCNKLGEFTITGVERARKGEPKVRAAARSLFALEYSCIRGVFKMCAPLYPILYGPF